MGHTGALEPGASNRGQSTRPPLYSQVLLALSLVFPLVLIYSAVQSYAAIVEMRAVYLRHRAAAIRDQVEDLPSLDSLAVHKWLKTQGDLLDLRIFREVLPAGDPDADAVNRLLTGQAIITTEERGHVYRIYSIVHPQAHGYRLAVARIDLSTHAGDALISDALLHVTIAYSSAMVSFATLAAYLVLARRIGRLENLARIGTMSAALAHEIRNPLGAIKGFVQLAQRKGDAAVTHYLDSGLREVVRLEKLVEDLLAFARVRKPVMRLTTWDSLVVRLQSPERAQRVRFLASPGLSFTTDPDLLLQILSNLIRNAEEASSEGTILVSARADEETLKIAVDDEGPGVPEHMKKSVFEPFVSTKASGTGLGLPISQKLAGQLNGQLRLVRRSPRGTSARLNLYRARAEHTNGNTSGN